jgi:2-amino-4-hydroxy-6-hydroxymethyldihydropteridine diphosphokinase
LEQEGLVVTHPLLAERAFVLVPLAELAPDLRHPVLGKPVGELLSALDEAALSGVRRIEPRGWEEESPPP